MNDFNSEANHSKEQCFLVKKNIFFIEITLEIFKKTV